MGGANHHRRTMLGKFSDMFLDLNVTASDVQKLVNNTKQYPFWFIIQAIWCTYTAKTANKHRKDSAFSKIMEFFISFVMTFGGREIAAYVLGHPSPLFANRFSVLIFTTIFILMNIPLIYKLFDSLSYFTGFLHGLNQERLYVRVFYRLLKKKEFSKNQMFFIIPALSSSLDQIVGGILGEFTEVSPFALSFGGVLITIILEFLHLSAVTKCPMNKWIGYHAKRTKPNMYLAFALAVFNAKESHIPKPRLKYSKEFDDKQFY